MLDKEQEYRTFSYHVILTLDQQQQNMKLPLLHFFLYFFKSNIQTGMSIRWVPLVEQELLTLPKHQSSPSVFSEICVTRSIVLHACFVDRCLSFLLWPLCCMSFFDLRILITPLVFSKSS